MAKQAANPTSTSIAGGHFESKVAAQYLLSMLSGAPGRGLPGVVISNVGVQKAPEGVPLDDISIMGQDYSGSPAQLDIQVKHKVRFSPEDSVFKDVCEQIAETVKADGFFDRRHEMAIAIARTSGKIDGPYQDVLTWARELSTPKAFFDRLGQPKVSDENKRTFVKTLRVNLVARGIKDEDQTIWSILRRLQILPFDYASPGSASLDLVHERAARCLADGHEARNRDLWLALTDRALEMAKAGGDCSRDDLSKHLREAGLPLSGVRKNTKAMAALDEDAKFALKAIGSKVGGAELARNSRIDQIREAHDSSRYVEIQGDSGVGKSGLLKHFGLQHSAQGRTLVLSPGRTTPGGWKELRATLGFDGTCRELLEELVLEGDGILLIDNIDRFSESERLTVMDIVSEAAGTAGLKVLATARRPLDLNSPRWLNAAKYVEFNVGSPVQIDDLTDFEIAELKASAPQLADLLEDRHPARSAARNLFRLSRLAERLSDASKLATEVDMMNDWWSTGDGGAGDEIRGRKRLLADMARHAIASETPFDSTSHDAETVTALVNQKTVRELGADRLEFYHDVLREWAVASLLNELPERVDALNLRVAATPGLARSIELLSCLFMVQDPTGGLWNTMLGTLNRTDNHLSWGRTGLLGLVRSHQFEFFLDQAKPLLLEAGAERLRRMIRFVRAVDVIPGRELMLEMGVPDNPALDTFNIPSGPSWQRLLDWVCANMSDIPASAHPDISDLFLDWSVGLLGYDFRVGVLTKWQFYWLNQIENARQTDSNADRYDLFNGDLSRDELRDFESSVRIAALSFADRAPDEAKAYLEALKTRRDMDRTILQVLNLSSSLAKIAPQELADLTCDFLFEDAPDDDDIYRRIHRRREIFCYLDGQFLPESPARGPFLALLNHHPQIGLELVRRIVAHAVERTGGAGDDPAFSIQWNDRSFVFTRFDSYGWTVPSTMGYAMGSALMALEAWGHKRIEDGDDPSNVIGDIIGESGSPAVFATVAVHLIISNLEQCQRAAIPFVSCPDLLIVDMERTIRQRVGGFDFFAGLGGNTEPQGGITRESLLTRPSRKHSLRDILEQAAVTFDPEHLAELQSQLKTVQSNLPEIEELASLRSPSLMVAYAINVTDPKNWIEKEVTYKGRKIIGTIYSPPPAEQAHFDKLNSHHGEQMNADNLRAEIMLAAAKPERSSPELAQRAADWVTRHAEQASEADETENWFNNETVVNAALVIVRDGDDKLVEAKSGWARSVFAAILKPQERHSTSFGERRFGVAFRGLVASLPSGPTRENIELVLSAVRYSAPCESEELIESLSELHAKSQNVLKSIVRCAIQERLYALNHWGWSEEDKQARAVCEADCKRLLDNRREAELDWLFADAPEPSWPALPRPQISIRRGIRIGSNPFDEVTVEPEVSEDFGFDADNAVPWIEAVAQAVPSHENGVLAEFIKEYADWTFEANGMGRDPHDQLQRTPDIWTTMWVELNAKFFDPSDGTSSVDRFWERLAALPHRQFLTVMDPYLMKLDVAYFEGDEQPPDFFVQIRTLFAEHLLTLPVMKHMVANRKPSIELDLGPAFGRLLFAYQPFRQPAKTYLTELSIDRARPFLPLMTHVATTAPSYYAAFAILSFVESTPRKEHLALVLDAAEAWLAHFSGDTVFWIDNRIGRRLIIYLDLLIEPDCSAVTDPLKSRIGVIASQLTALGLPDAAQLEAKL